MLRSTVDIANRALDKNLALSLEEIVAAYDAEAAAKGLDVDDRATSVEIRNELVRRALKADNCADAQRRRLDLLTGVGLRGPDAGTVGRTIGQAVAVVLGGVVLGLATVVLTGLSSGAHFAGGEVGRLALGLSIAAGGFLSVALMAWTVGALRHRR